MMFQKYVEMSNILALCRIKFVSDFISMTKDEEQVQCVEHHRDLFPDYTKKPMAKLNCWIIVKLKTFDIILDKQF